MKRFASLLVAAASLTMAFNIVSYDGLTGHPSLKIPTVYHRVKDGSIEKYVTPAYTDNTGQVYVSARDRDLLILNTRYLGAYECAAGIDTGKCLTGSATGM